MCNPNIAIVVVGYNRVDSLARLLDTLDKAYYPQVAVPLIISIDKSDTDAVERYADGFDWQHGSKQVVKHEQRMGLRNHILSLGQHFDHYDALIVLEDDLSVSPNFYLYAMQAVEKYHDDDRIAGISLFSFAINYQTGHFFQPIKDHNDVYFMNCAQSWGQVWMKRQWLRFYEWYNDHTHFPQQSPLLPPYICTWPATSWLKYHTRYCAEENLYFVYPYVAYTTNNGDTGTHNGGSYINLNQERLQRGRITTLRLPHFDEEETVCYDVFFENKKLAQVLNLDDDQCCVDLNGERDNRENKRYWLTTKQCNYKICRQFGVRYRPIDENIYAATPGCEIYLYDTTQVVENTFKHTFSHLLYDIRIDTISRVIRTYGKKRAIREAIKRLFRRK